MCTASADRETMRLYTLTPNFPVNTKSFTLLRVFSRSYKTAGEKFGTIRGESSSVRDFYTLGMGLPVYHGLNQVFANGKYICDAGDGLYCFYVNGDFRDPGHPIGRMIHDFYCTYPEDMLVPVLREAVKCRIPHEFIEN